MGVQGGVVDKSWETIKVKGEDLLKSVKQILHEGNVRRIVIKQGSRTVAEFPVTVGLVGAVAAPMLAALGAVAALLTECTIEVERKTPAPSPKAAPKPTTLRKPNRKA
jgi:Domain of unknown function (DUF4342)